MITRKYGYVIEMRKTSDSYPGFYSTSHYAGPLRSAEVFRKQLAYALRYEDETVRRVELFKNGNPKRVVK